MNYQQMLEAREQLIIVDAFWLGGSAIAMIIAAIVATRLSICAIKRNEFMEAPYILSIISVVIAFLGVIMFCCAIYNKQTAHLTAISSMANYNLVEIKK